MLKEEVAMVEEIARRIAKEELLLAFAVKLPKVIAEPVKVKPALKAKKLGGKR